MLFELITLFPSFYDSFFKTGLIAKAVNKGVLQYKIIGLRKYGEGRLKKVDATPYGGSQGMLIKEKTLASAYNLSSKNYLVNLSPRGKTLNNTIAKKLAKKQNLTIVCGHYEGLDQRFIDRYVDEEISIGDYILLGGETASLVLMEVIARYLEGFLGNPLSHQEESFENGLLENDQYTKPFSNQIPEVLISGNHKAIKSWTLLNGLIKTYQKRPDILKKKNLSLEEEIKLKNYFYNQFLHIAYK